jgi:hypothetical protein
VTKLDAAYDYIESAGFSATDKLLVLEWNEVSLYPAGTPSAQLTYNATLIHPEGWKYGTSLPVESEDGNRVVFKPISFDLLVDSPVSEGQYYRVVNITPPGEKIHHELDLVADSEAALAITPALQKGLTNVVAESGALFGTRHYRDYHFLLTLSDHVAHFGLEHHESNDSRLPERALISPGAGFLVGGLLPHEFVHSWNGKFRRPADLTTPDFEKPMETDARGAQWAVDSGGISRVPGQHLRIARPWPAWPHMAAAGGYGDRRAWGRTGRRRARLAQLAPRHRLLRRRRPGMARSRDHHPQGEQRPKVHRRLLPSLPWRGEQRTRGKTLDLRRTRRGFEPGCAL